MLVVDGNPLDDIAILQDHGNLHYIMKDGRFHSEPGKPGIAHTGTGSITVRARSPSLERDETGLVLTSRVGL